MCKSVLAGIQSCIYRFQALRSSANIQIVSRRRAREFLRLAHRRSLITSEAFLAAHLE